MFLSLQLFGASPFKKERVFLEKLGDFEKRRENHDPLPYLVVSSAQAYKTSQEILYKNVKQILMRGKTELTVLNKKEDLKIPIISISGSELEGIEKCNQIYCAVKLLNSTEKKRLENSRNKLGMFQEFLFERLVAYYRSGELRGSEEVFSNLETLKRGYSQLEFFSELYPKTHTFLIGNVLGQRKVKVEKPFVNSFLNIETIHLEADKVKPVLRMSEIFEFEEGGTNIFFDLHIYSNHFFDSSLRVTEVQKHPYPGMPSKLIVTDVMEIDELKKSGLIRALFKGRMVSGVHFYQDTLLDLVKSETQGSH